MRWSRRSATGSAIDPAHLVVLTEQPKDGELRGTAENVRATFERLAKETKADDVVFVMLIGHGSGDAAAAKFNLVGPDLTAVEWRALLDPVPARMAVVDSTSSSFPFLEGLSGKNRIVITATNSFAQRYHTYFPAAFIQALVVVGCRRGQERAHLLARGVHLCVSTRRPALRAGRAPVDRERADRRHGRRQGPGGRGSGRRRRDCGPDLP